VLTTSVLCGYGKLVVSNEEDIAVAVYTGIIPIAINIGDTQYYQQGINLKVLEPVVTECVIIVLKNQLIQKKGRGSMMKLIINNESHAMEMAFAYSIVLKVHEAGGNISLYELMKNCFPPGERLSDVSDHLSDVQCSVTRVFVLNQYSNTSLAHDHTYHVQFQHFIDNKDPTKYKVDTVVVGFNGAIGIDLGFIGLRDGYIECPMFVVVTVDKCKIMTVSDMSMVLSPGGQCLAHCERSILLKFISIKSHYKNVISMTDNNVELSKLCHDVANLLDNIDTESFSYFGQRWKAYADF
jgi:hypothetical protein